MFKTFSTLAFYIIIMICVTLFQVVYFINKLVDLILLSVHYFIYLSCPLLCYITHYYFNENTLLYLPSLSFMAVVPQQLIV